MPLENSNFYEFGPYRIDTVERRLLRGDEPIPLTPKAYDTLLALVENAGNGLKKDELMRRVWPDTFVEESGLIRNISVLRKALGDEDGRYIETLPKHGYRLHPGGSGYPLGHLAVAGAAAYFAGRRGSLPVVRSLAVLPLKDLSSDAGERYLGLGIADSIIGKVSEISGLTVRTTGAVRQYVDAKADPLRAARELKVDAILDGTLQVAGNRARVNLNLLQTSSGASLWTHVFDLGLSEIFEVEDEIALQVARQLRLHLDRIQRANVARHSTTNPEAYEHHLKGLYNNETPYMTRAGRGAIEAAIVRFRKATELGPYYAQAWAQLAVCYNELIVFHRANVVEEARGAPDAPTPWIRNCRSC